MGFWSSLGKTLLEAAPYVAAPFTGGLSLMATPATSKIVDAWNQHDLKNDIAQGIAPSGYDKYLGMAGDIGSIGAGVYGGVAGLSGLSSLGSAGKVVSMAAPIASAAAGQAIGNAINSPSSPSGSTNQTTQSPSASTTGVSTAGAGSGLSPSSSVLSAIGNAGASMHSLTSGTSVGQAVPSGSTGGIGPSGYGQTGYGYLNGFGSDQTNPNLSNALSAGAAAGQQNLNKRNIYGNFSPYQASY